MKIEYFLKKENPVTSLFAVVYGLALHTGRAKF
jgi:hypothetical protein